MLSSYVICIVSFSLRLVNSISLYVPFFSQLALPASAPCFTVIPFRAIIPPE